MNTPDAPITYLDHAATTPMRAVAVEAMQPYLGVQFANPSGSYRFAREARRAVDDARDAVADAVGCAPGEIVFTGGGTESDNAAISGAVWRCLRANASGRAIAACPAVEHHAVLHPVERHDSVIVGVDRFGHVDLDALREALVTADGTVAVVSVMAVNNEVGTVTDLAAVAAVVREAAPDAVLHSDAVQAASWLDLRTVWPHVDAMSLSGHKFGGPKGVGVLALRQGAAVDPLIVGGGQERDRRSGTHNVAGIVGAAAALAETDAQRGAECARVGALRDRLVKGLVAGGGVIETVPAERKVPGAAHVLIDGVESEAILFLADQAGLCASAASACASGAMERSHVLAAMGVDSALIAGALRLTLGHTTTDTDVDRAVEVLTDAIATIRSRTGSAP